MKKKKEQKIRPPLPFSPDETLTLYLKKKLLLQKIENQDRKVDTTDFYTIKEHSFQNNTAYQISESILFLYCNGLIRTLSFFNHNYPERTIDFGKELDNYLFILDKSRGLDEDPSKIDDWNYLYSLKEPDIINKLLEADINNFKSHKHNLLIYDYGSSLNFFLDDIEKKYKYGKSMNYLYNMSSTIEEAKKYFNDYKSTTNIDVLRTLLTMEKEGFITITNLKNNSIQWRERDDIEVKIKILPPIFNKLYEKYKTKFSDENNIPKIYSSNPTVQETVDDKSLEQNKRPQEISDSVDDLKIHDKDYKSSDVEVLSFEVTYTHNEVWVSVKGKMHKIGETAQGKDPDLFMSHVINHPKKDITLEIINKSLNELIKDPYQGKRSFPTLISELGFKGNELKKAFFPTRNARKVVFRRELTSEDIKNKKININEELLIEQIEKASSLCTKSK